MTESEKSSSRPNDSTESSLLVIGTFLGTTWRMFVPVFGGAMAGYVVDVLARTRPVGVVVGMGIGIVLAIWLVTLQYRAVTRSRPRSQSKHGRN